jgi:MFS family permease
MNRDTGRAATYALAVLTFINLFNYLDRWVVSALLESIKKELHLSDTQLGFVATGFLAVYTLASPIFGSLGDRKRRPPLIAAGVAIWSVATALGGFARGFPSLFLARSTVGIGEAAYGTIAPPLLADAYPIERRGRVMSIFFAAIPLGSAAGYVLGGLAGARYGWRAAFFIAGTPGLILALLVLLVKDPPRGQNDDATVPRAARAGWTSAYADLLRNPVFMLTALGYGAYTFGLGGLAYWMPPFLERVRGMSHREATVTFGLITLVTGFVGTFAGGWLGDYFRTRNTQSYLWVSGIATFLAAPAVYFAVSSANRSVFLPAIVIGEVLIFMCTGPVNSALVNAVAPTERATALGLSVFLMHLIGDMPAPPLIGAISDRSSLATALLVVPVSIVISGVIWVLAAMRGQRSA